ncbi:DNA topoisomerase I, partial [Staphylococcus pseudintermedius]
STYAPTIDTVPKRNYAKNESKRFVPTELIEMLHEQVREYSPEILHADVNVNKETLLDKLAACDMGWKKLVGDFVNTFKQEVDGLEQDI